MGKSPGKWIKGIIFGKKASKANSPKERNLTKSASEKPVRASSKERTPTIIVDTPLISDPVPCRVIDIMKNSGPERNEITTLPNDGEVSSPEKQEADVSTVSDHGLSDASEKMKLEQAAIVVQASLRSYQARREFQNLKGIIKLQAVVRGRLVRRQAVATLFCVKGIVKLQAIARGNMVRQSNAGKEQNKFVTSEGAKQGDSTDISKCSTSLENNFISKLLYASPTAMPLCLQYGAGEPNSAWDWLLRWSISQAWATNSKMNMTCYLKDETIKIEGSKPNSGESVPSVTVRSTTNHAKLETEKPKQKAKRVLNQSVKYAQEHSESGNNKVKRGLKKVAKPTGVLAEVDDEKPKRNSRKLSKTAASKIPEQTSIIGKPKENLREVVPEPVHVELNSERTETDQLDSHHATEGYSEPVRNSVELFNSEASKIPEVTSILDKPKENLEVLVSEPLDMELSLAKAETNKSDDHQAKGEHSELVSNKSQDSFPVDNDIKDDLISCENSKSSRRNTLPAKLETQQPTLESTKKVPSYMATTAASKAKVKVQGSPRFAQDAVDKNVLARRYSLPSSVNVKQGLSPRVHRLVQNNGKGAKLDRSMNSSRDFTDKVIQTDWKR